MNQVDAREVNRESMLLLANLRIDGQGTIHRVRVRNLSAGGMMAETDLAVSRGTRVSVELRRIGWVEGSVAWRQGSRFGIAFVETIDPCILRETEAEPEGRAYERRRFSPIMPVAPDRRKLRPI